MISPIFMLSSAGGMFVLQILVLATNVQFVRHKINPHYFRAYYGIIGAGLAAAGTLWAPAATETAESAQETANFFAIIFIAAALWYGWHLLYVIESFIDASRSPEGSELSASARTKIRLRRILERKVR